MARKSRWNHESDIKLRKFDIKQVYMVKVSTVKWEEIFCNEVQFLWENFIYHASVYKNWTLPEYISALTMGPTKIVRTSDQLTARAPLSLSHHKTKCQKKSISPASWMQLQFWDSCMWYQKCSWLATCYLDATNRNQFNPNRNSYTKIMEPKP